MKKFIIFVLCILLFVLNYMIIISEDNTSDIMITNETNFIFANQEMAIFGNLTDMNENNSRLIKNHINNSQHVLLYDLSGEVVSYKSDDVNEDVFATVYSKQNGVLYRRTFSTIETDNKKILKGINQFFSEFIDDVSQETSEMIEGESFLMSSIEPVLIDNGYVKVEVSSGVRELKPYGKIEYVTDVYMNQVDDEYGIYIVETESRFIPGYAMRKSGDKTYNNYISTKSRQITSISKVGRIYYGNTYYGEIPNVLEYWPKNLVVNGKNSRPYNTGLQIDFSILYEFIDPSMSATTLEIGSVYGWNFEYKNIAVRRSIHNFASGQMVEMPNGVFNGQFSIEHDFEYCVDMFLGHRTYIKYTPSFTVYAFDGHL